MNKPAVVEKNTFEVVLPPSVKRQIDAAAVAFEQNKAAMEAATAAPTDEPPTSPPVADPVPTPAASSTTTSENVEKYWEERFRVIQGKYNNEVPAYAGQVRLLQEQMAALTQQLETAKAAKPSQPAERKVTEAEVDEFGPELVDLIGRRAEEMYAPIVADLKSQISALHQQVTGIDRATAETAAEAARQRTIDVLRAQVPQCDSINTSADFMLWLNQVDVYAGVSKGVMLREAYEQNDVTRVIAIFKGFQDESAPNARETNRGSVTGIPLNDLSRMVSPGGAANTALPANGAQSSKRQWTPETIGRFYADVNRGAFRGRDAEKTAIEREIIEFTSGRRKAS